MKLIVFPDDTPDAWEDIINPLLDHGIPLASWGKGSARTLDDFIKCMSEEKVRFRGTDSYPLIIDVHVAVIIVFYKDGDRTYELYEDRQEFSNGSILRRSFRGIGDTVKRNESERDAAIRCLSEELGFNFSSQFCLTDNVICEIKDPVESEKWPGLYAAYIRHIFVCHISPTLYRPEGYVESTADRKIFFKWK